MRGAITEEIQKLANELLGIELKVRELRLMPYIQFTMMNNQCLDPVKISPEERKILRFWKDKGFMEGGASGLTVTKEFWDAMNQILWLGYVNHE